MEVFHDISLPLKAGIPVYPGDPDFSMKRVTDMEQGAAYTLSEFSMSAHNGTHIDAPAHFIRNGKVLSQYSPDRWLSRALVVEINASSILPEHIPQDAISPGDSVLFKTSNSRFLRDSAFPQRPCFIDVDSAELLAQLKPGLVGIDWLTVEDGEDGDYPVHTTLLKNDILILESILLDQVLPGSYTLISAPLALEGSEAAPARAILYNIEGILSNN